MGLHSVLLSVFTILIIALIINLTICAIVTTHDGMINGTTMVSRRGEPFHAFLKIPFAQPPIGERRFKGPVPNEPWSGILDGTEFGPACSQLAGLIPAANISEDCLHLNVFTKKLPENGTALTPVIVFIHGGGFEYGSAIICNPRVLMDRDVVIVTMNYRLNAFGFIATGTEQAPGNNGLKDQVMALTWIRRNIATFNGDDENITVWGMSAGAIAATAHMVSPRSYGLFDRVIAMSGAITSHRNLTNDLMSNVKTLANGLSCENNNPDEIVNCLRNRTQEQILSIPMRASGEPCPRFPWGPVVEPDFGQDRFLEDQPKHLYENGNFIRVPTLIGITSDEFVSVVPGMVGNNSLMLDLNERFPDIAPSCFLYEENTEKSKAMSKSFRDNYFPYDVIDSTAFEDMNHLISDSIMGYPTHIFVNTVSEFIDVFYYKFSFVGSFSLFIYPRNAPYSTVHGDDLHYLFPYNFFPSIEVDNQDNFMVEQLSSMVETFAKNGNPNNSTDPHLTEMIWPAYKKDKPYYLDIYRHLVEKQDLNKNRFERWSVVENKSAPS